MSDEWIDGYSDGFADSAKIGGKDLDWYKEALATLSDSHTRVVQSFLATTAENERLWNLAHENDDRADKAAAEAERWRQRAHNAWEQLDRVQFQLAIAEAKLARKENK